jgi:membrane fusion protein (multidrug efflux system)
MNRSPRVAALFFLGALLGACSKSEADGRHHEAKHPVVLTTPRVMDVPTTKSFVSQIHARRHIDIRALDEGYLEEIPIQEGQLVKAGQRLYGLVPVLYRTQLDADKAELRRAEIALQNTEKLAERGVVAPPELAMAQAERDRAKAHYDRALAEYEFTKIVAPFDGIVGRQLMQQGSLVEAGHELTTISDNAVMWVYFNVPEAEYLRFKSRPGANNPEEPQKLALTNTTVQLRLANGELFDQEAAPTLTIESDFDSTTGNIMFRADFPNPQGLLRHGQTGTLLITETVPDALVIPQRATYEVLDRQYVFVVDEHGVAHQRQITVAHELEDIYVIRKGISAGERFIVEGVRQARDGEALEHTETRAPEDVLGHLKQHAE